MKLSPLLTGIKHIKRDINYYLELSRLSGPASLDYGISRLSIFFRGAELLRKYRFTPGFAYDLGLLNPEMNTDEVKQMISREHFSRLQVQINPDELYSLTENKGLFYKFCKLNNIPHPKIYIEFFRNSVNIRREQSDSNESFWIKFIDEKLPASFVIKPHAGVYGRGIKGICRHKNGFIDHNDNELSAKDIFTFMQSHREFNNFLIQELLQPHKSIAGLTESKSVSTLRTVTLVEKSGKAKILYAALKLVTGNNFIDNHERGVTGNLIALIDLKKGEIIKILGTVNNRGIAEEIKIHPVTGKELLGFKIPMWSDFKNTIKYTAEKFLPLRCIGWDVAITDNGVKIIEGNVMFDPPNFFRLGRMIENEILKTIEENL